MCKINKNEQNKKVKELDKVGYDKTKDADVKVSYGGTNELLEGQRIFFQEACIEMFHFSYLKKWRRND